MNELVAFLLTEEYDFELKSVGGEPIELNITMFGGHLLLVGDGTWSYEED